MKSGILSFGPRHIILLLLILLLAIQTGCSSSYRGSKGKYGQVPCPCDKKR